jgi:hypothetical protein
VTARSSAAAGQAKLLGCEGPSQFSVGQHDPRGHRALDVCTPSHARFHAATGLLVSPSGPLAGGQPRYRGAGCGGHFLCA